MIKYYEKGIDSDLQPRYAYTPYIWPMLAPAVNTAALVIFVWRRRPVPGALPLALAMLYSIPLGYSVALQPPTGRAMA
jgi:hypothetical protein